MMAKQWIWKAGVKHSETPTHQRGKTAQPWKGNVEVCGGWWGHQGGSLRVTQVGSPGAWRRQGFFFPHLLFKREENLLPGISDPVKPVEEASNHTLKKKKKTTNPCECYICTFAQMVQGNGGFVAEGSKISPVSMAVVARLKLWLSPAPRAESPSSHKGSPAFAKSWLRKEGFKFQP